MANVFRPLQPAPMDGQEQAPPPPERPPLTQKPKRTVTLGACVACRRRKSKCDGARPTCTCCAQKDTECVYELGPNEKPSQAMKRKNEEMQGELLNLRHLYDFLRFRPEQEAQEILKRIRSDPSDAAPPSQRIQELADLVRHGDLLLPHPSLASPSPTNSDLVTLPPLRMALGAVIDPGNTDPSPLSHSLPFPTSYLLADIQGPTSQRRRHASDADVSARSDSTGSLPHPSSIKAIIHEPSFASMHEQTDPRLSSAVNWTDATDDAGLVESLLLVWHKWEYSYFHFFDWECFLHDMTTGQTNFCSKLLVNALLATAGFQSTLVKGRSEPFADNVITMFYSEARRLWEAEEGQDSLTRLQAALLLFLVLGKHGRDKVGHMFLGEACRVGHQIGLFRFSSASSTQRPPGVSEQRWETSRAVTAWALFNFQLAMSLTYSFAPIIKSQPPVPIPYQDTPETEALFRSACEQHIIMSDVLNTLWDEDIADSEIPPKPEQVEVLYLRLKSWWDLRPQSLDPISNPSPEKLLTAMLYHCANIRLCQPFLRRDSSLERVKSYCTRAQAISSAAMKDLRQLITIHEIRHGWSNAIPFILHPVMVASIGSAEEVARDRLSSSQLYSSETYLGLLTCLRALSSFSKFIFYAQPLFRVVTQTCQTLGIRLPTEAINALDQYQTNEWTKNAANMVSSQYVADMRETATDLESSRMDSVIAQWDSMVIGEKTKEPGSGIDGTPPQPDER